jgi:hypothetical protein
MAQRCASMCSIYYSALTPLAWQCAVRNSTPDTANVVLQVLCRTLCAVRITSALIACLFGLLHGLNQKTIRAAFVAAACADHSCAGCGAALHLPGSLPGLRRGTNGTPSASASGAPKMRPRASKPAEEMQ